MNPRAAAITALVNGLGCDETRAAWLRYAAATTWHPDHKNGRLPELHSDQNVREKVIEQMWRRHWREQPESQGIADLLAGIDARVDGMWSAYRAQEQMWERAGFHEDLNPGVQPPEPFADWLALENAPAEQPAEQPAPEVEEELEIEGLVSDEEIWNELMAASPALL